ncbi:MAG TPA: gamma-glutamyltransferase [Mariprofundaceae bacterium]|nr:gamma-glutamyltransferase [Mariprofundaceae bacterium]
MKRLAVLFILLLSAATAARAASPSQGMVVSAHTQATQAGIDVLNRGGNAFDAAAATALALGVVEPGSSGIGGGGFFLLYIAKQHRYVMIDARETAPQLAGHGEIYRKASSIDGPQAAGVPGLIAGVDRLIGYYGRLGRKADTAAAIRLARHGFAVYPRYRKLAGWRRKALQKNMAGRMFLDHGKVPAIGHTIRQPVLARTLARFARFGASDFYRGQTADRLVSDMKRDGGLIRLKDLAAYRAVERKPVQFDYHGYHIVSASLPSSGGRVLAEIFGMLRHDDFSALSTVDRDHLLIETMKRAYRDRNAYLGDPAFVTVPDLLNPKRLQAIRDSIRMDRATPSSELGHSAAAHGDGHNTTHFSVIDSEGNMVAATLSVNYGFGSGYLSPSTGILLNDEMDDFATRPGEPNVYGLVQGKANAVAPGKRMLSSMDPTFVVGPARTLIVGTPGGSRIISMVLLASMRFMLDETPPADWVGHPRFHHQFLPDVVQHEPGAFPPDVATELKRRGHKLKRIHRYGNMEAILWDRSHDRLTGLPDPRGEGVAATTR